MLIFFGVCFVSLYTVAIVSIANFFANDMWLVGIFCLMLLVGGFIPCSSFVRSLTA